MSNRETILTPVGRLVQGSLYEGQTTDAEGNPLVYKTGANAGQPRVDFYFAIAVEKGLEKHWAETEWGKKIWNIGHVGFPKGQANSPSFAWKIIDGDSALPNRKGHKPCDREGYPKHWVLNFTSGFSPSVYDGNGNQQILVPDHVKLGDYIQVFGHVTDNGSEQQPGVFLNHSMVAFAGFGKRIFLGPNPKEVGFGNCALPAGASLTPLASGFSPTTPVPSTSTPPAVTPYPAILTPPIPSAPVHTMLSKANGLSYEQLIGAGWTDQLLIQHGYMAS